MVKTKGWDRDRVSQWAVGLFKNPKYNVILDTETTDLKGEAIELSIINLEGETVFNRRFRPRLPIHPKAAAVHGLTVDLLSMERDFADYEPQVTQVLGHADRVLIYNADFDNSILRKTYALRDLKLPVYKSHCLMKAYAIWKGEQGRYGNFKWHKLPEGDHSALGDCLSTLKVLKEMAGRV